MRIITLAEAKKGFQVISEYIKLNTNEDNYDNVLKSIMEIENFLDNKKELKQKTIVDYFKQ